MSHFFLYFTKSREDKSRENIVHQNMMNSSDDSFVRIWKKYLDTADIVFT